MTFPLLIHSNITKVLRPSVVYALISIEIAADLLAILFIALLCVVISRSNAVHPSFRLINISIALYYIIAIAARCVIIYYQLNNIPIIKSDVIILTCDVIRDHLLGFFISQLGAISLERTVATNFWRWYERRGLGTILVFLAAEIFAVVPSLANVLLCEFDVYSHVINFCLCCLIVAGSFLLYLLVFYDNFSMLRKLRSNNDGYSIAKAFQVKENIAVLKVVFLFQCSTVPILYFSIILFTLYFVGPSFLQVTLSTCIIVVDISIAIYVPIFVLLVAHGMPEYRRQLYKIDAIKRIASWTGVKGPLKTTTTAIQRETETNLYFGHLAAAWG